MEWSIRLICFVALARLAAETFLTAPSIYKKLQPFKTFQLPEWAKTLSFG